MAIGLPELVCASQKEYEDLAVTLGSDPSKYSLIKEKLAHNRTSTLLFDIDTFTTNLELAFSRVHERRQSGALPDHIFI
jgi:predicted O-linked N-acetylglucosamine transferase (SPINDLY family)